MLGKEMGSGGAMRGAAASAAAERDRQRAAAEIREAAARSAAGSAWPYTPRSLPGKVPE